MKHPIEILILLAAAAILLIAVKWAFLPFVPWRRLPRNRVRHLRLRLHLRLHPGAGHATILELWLRWGRFAVLRRSGRARRSCESLRSVLRNALKSCGQLSKLVVSRAGPSPGVDPARASRTSADRWPRKACRKRC